MSTKIALDGLVTPVAGFLVHSSSRAFNRTRSGSWPRHCVAERLKLLPETTTNGVHIPPGRRVETDRAVLGSRDTAMAVSESATLGRRVERHCLQLNQIKQKDEKTKMAEEESGKQESVNPGKRQLTEEEIRSRAYEIYCARNGAFGDEVSDWLKAEAELKGDTVSAG